MFSGLDQTTLLWIGIALLVVLGFVWVAISVSSSRETLKGARRLLDRTDDERDDDDEGSDARVS